MARPGGPLLSEAGRRALGPTIPESIFTVEPTKSGLCLRLTLPEVGS